MIKTDTGDPAPMDVDRIEDKGKGKGKSKSKCKGKRWQIPFYPNCKGNYKGKGKSKGKQGGKGRTSAAFVELLAIGPAIVHKECSR